MIVPGTPGSAVRTLTALQRAMLKSIKRFLYIAACVTWAAVSAADGHEMVSPIISDHHQFVRQGETRQCPSWNQSTPAGPPRLRLQQSSLIFLPAGAAASRSKVLDSGSATAVVTLTDDDLSAKLTSNAPRLRATDAKLAPSSPLITNSKLRVKLANVEWAGHILTMVVADDTSVGSRLLALVSRREGVSSSDASYHWFPVSDNSSTPHPLDLAALEHLYRFAVNHVATDKFRFRVVKDGRADGRLQSGEEKTHAQLLAQLASARQCVTDALGATGAEPAKPWRAVSIRSIPTAADKMVVAARVSDVSGQVVGAMISFSRAPHFDCSAKSDSTGLATCRLEDTHGHGEDVHGHADHGHASANTIATYPGDIRPEVIMLPTTSVR